MEEEALVEYRMENGDSARAGTVNDLGMRANMGLRLLIETGLKYIAVAQLAHVVSISRTSRHAHVIVHLLVAFRIFYHSRITF